jgi:hypothetical protein
MDETVDSSKFKLRVDLQGVDNLQDSLNILSLYQSWRYGDCCLQLEEIGLSPSLISAAIHYILMKYHASASLYQCYKCCYCKNDLCVRTTKECSYKPINDE